MLAVVSWECVCGMKVKAMYETGGMTRIRCPKPSCTATHIVDGVVSELWTKDDSKDWRAHDLQSLIVPCQ